MHFDGSVILADYVTDKKKVQFLFTNLEKPNHWEDDLSPNSPIWCAVHEHW